MAGRTRSRNDVLGGATRPSPVGLLDLLGAAPEASCSGLMVAFGGRGGVMVGLRRLGRRRLLAGVIGSALAATLLVLWDANPAFAVCSKIYPFPTFAEDVGGNTVILHFGVDNQETSDVAPAINNFIPALVTPPATFHPGVTLNALTVTVDRNTYNAVEWQLDCQSVLVSDLSNPSLSSAGFFPLPAGPAGPPGPPGSSGPQGSAGSQGATGAPGVSGAGGSTGVSGRTGSAGQSGSQGGTGLTGSGGARGVAGPRGLRGPRGSAGSSISTTLWLLALLAAALIGALSALLVMSIFRRRVPRAG